MLKLINSNMKNLQKHGSLGKENESFNIAVLKHPAPSSHSHSQVEHKKNKVADDQKEKQLNRELEINVIMFKSYKILKSKIIKSTKSSHVAVAQLVKKGKSHPLGIL